MATLTDTELRRVQQDIKFLGTHALRVGWISNPIKSPQSKFTKDSRMRDGKGIKTPVTVGEVARAHELGRGVPRRSMLKATLKRRRPQIRQLQAEVADAVIAGRVGPRQGLALLGEGVLTQIKDRMVKGISPPLARSTKESKANATASGARKDTPLIRWGVMLNSVRYKIVSR